MIQLGSLALPLFANSLQAALRTRRNRFIRPSPTERALRSGHRPDHANVADDFIALGTEHQLRSIKAPLVTASFDTVISSPRSVALLHEVNSLLAPSRPIGCCLRRSAHDSRPSLCPGISHRGVFK
jgi:hypothetical protein